MKKTIILLFLVLMTACAVSPTGRTQLMLVSPEKAISASWQAYYETLLPLEKEGRIDTSTQVTSRVKRITGKIIAQAIKAYPETAAWHWCVKVIDDPASINAWCMAGGQMAVYTGLLTAIQPTDDELAQVMGHEIAHAIANHTAEKMSLAIASHIGVNTVAIFTGAIEEENATLARAKLAAVVAIELPHNREAEMEADRIGVELAARAGYHPGAAVSLWQKMLGVGGNDLPEFLSTHPGPIVRIARLRNLIPLMMPYYDKIQDRPVYRFDEGVGLPCIGIKAVPVHYKTKNYDHSHYFP